MFKRILVSIGSLFFSVSTCLAAPALVSDGDFRYSVDGAARTATVYEFKISTNFKKDFVIPKYMSICGVRFLVNKIVEGSIENAFHGIRSIMVRKDFADDAENSEVLKKASEHGIILIVVG